MNDLNLKKIPINFSWLFLGYLIAKGLAFLAVVYLARVLGDVGFGKMSFVQAFLAYGILITDFGVSTYGVREVAKDKTRLKELVVHIQVIRLVLAIIVFIIVIVSVLLFVEQQLMRLLFVFFFLSLFPYAMGVEWAFRGLEKMQYTSLWNSLQQFILLILIVLFVKSSKDLIFVPLYKVLGVCAASFFLLRMFFKREKLVNVKKILKVLDLSLCKTILRVSLPLMASSLVVKIYFNFDIIMLGVIDKPEVVGWYNAAYKVILLCIGFCYIITGSFTPSLSHSYKNQRKRYRSLFKKMFFFIGACGFFFTIVVFNFRNYIINTLFGSAYKNAVIPLMILSFVIIWEYLVSALGSAYVAAGFEKITFLAVLIGAVTNICLNLLLIPRYSLIGAAVSTNISYIFILLCYLYFFKKSIWRSE
ncbi:MAG: flippase [Candidatus Helarchaeota archaeon]